MELEKLKEIWTTLDNSMQQQEGLKTAIIKEMFISKSDKALSRLINYGYFGIIIFLISMPLLIWAWSKVPNYFFIYKSFILITILYLLSIIVISAIELKMLHKIDFSSPINTNIRIVQKINIFNKRLSISFYIMGAILYIFGITAAFISFRKIDLWMWMLYLSGLFIGVIGSIWEYKRVNRRNFDSILKSLEELKELEEEVDVVSEKNSLPDSKM